MADYYADTAVCQSGRDTLARSLLADDKFNETPREPQSRRSDLSFQLQQLPSTAPIAIGGQSRLIENITGPEHLAGMIFEIRAS